MGLERAVKVIKFTEFDAFLGPFCKLKKIASHDATKAKHKRGDDHSVVKEPHPESRRECHRWGAVGQEFLSRDSARVAFLDC